MPCVCMCVCVCSKWWYPKKWARLIFHRVHRSNQSKLKHYSNWKEDINKTNSRGKKCVFYTTNARVKPSRYWFISLFHCLVIHFHLEHFDARSNAAIKMNLKKKKNNKISNIPFRQLFAFILMSYSYFRFWFFFTWFLNKYYFSCLLKIFFHMNNSSPFWRQIKTYCTYTLKFTCSRHKMNNSL